jgi:hypothetical protein
VIYGDDASLCDQALSLSQERPGPIAIVMDPHRVAASIYPYRVAASKGCGKRPEFTFWGIRESVSVQLVP